MESFINNYCRQLFLAYTHLVRKVKFSFFVDFLFSSYIQLLFAFITFYDHCPGLTRSYVWDILFSILLLLVNTRQQNLAEIYCPVSLFIQIYLYCLLYSFLQTIVASHPSANAKLTNAYTLAYTGVWHCLYIASLWDRE